MCVHNKRRINYKIYDNIISFFLQYGNYRFITKRFFNQYSFLENKF